MRKFECKKADCPYKRCYVEMEDHRIGICLNGWTDTAEWNEQLENPEQLSKLTVETLAERNIEWPDDMVCAIVNKFGIASFSPIIELEYSTLFGNWKGVAGKCKPGQHFIEIPGKWDASDWTNSLVERPAPAVEVPDWFKVGALIHNKAWGFARIVAICGDHQSIEVHYLSGGTGCPIIANCKPARLVPWDYSSIPGVPFGVRSKETTWNGTTVLSSNSSAVHIYGREYAVSYKKLMEEYELPDGSPCGVPEVIE